MKLADFLVTSVPFSQDELNDILYHFEKEYAQKNQVLIKEGQVCNKLYFVGQGMGRSYYLKKDGKEITQWFFGAGEFMSHNKHPKLYFLI